MDHYYQLTYSVKPRAEDGELAAQRVRKAMKEDSAWDSLRDIETTVVSVLTLDEKTEDEKREEAKKLISERIKDIMESSEAYHDVDVYASLMVDQLGPHIEFKV
ncbi:hypothetical protein [Pseudoalteromonas maricaloris]|uniref:hypothetical protein n=1 Tax=Pseudoalteromonas maricaloris TaxID=184924 RepID=UPI003C2431DC